MAGLQTPPVVMIVVQFLPSLTALSAVFLEFIPRVDKTPICPVSVKPCKLFHLLRMFVGEVVNLCPFRFEIVEFPIAGEPTDEFPPVLTDCTIPFVFPIEYLFTVIFSIKNGY